MAVSITLTGSNYANSLNSITSLLKADIAQLPATQKEEFNRMIGNVQSNLSFNEKDSREVNAQKFRIALNELKGIKAKLATVAQGAGISPQNLEAVNEEIKNAEGSSSSEGSKEQPETGEQTRSDGQHRTGGQYRAGEDAETGDHAGRMTIEKDPQKSDSKSAAEEKAKLLSSVDPGKKSSVLKNILGAALIGGSALGTYFLNKSQHEDQKKYQQRMIDQMDAAEKGMQEDPHNPRNQALYSKALSEKIMSQKEDVINRAFKLLEKDRKDRHKAANDVGLNIGNFARIFGSDKNRDSLQKISDLDSLLNMQSRNLNSYL